MFAPKTMKKSTVINLVAMIVVSFFLSSCGTAEIEKLNGELKSARAEKRTAQNNFNNCSRERDRLQEIADSVSIYQQIAVTNYREAITGREEELRRNGALEIPITQFDPQLEWATWSEIEAGLAILKSGNQIRNAKMAFLSMFFSELNADGSYNYNSLQYYVWEGLKTALKTNPAKVEKLFNAASPVLKVFKNTAMGELMGVTPETKGLLNKSFSSDLAKKFLEIYNSVDHSDRDNYINKLQEVQKTGVFEKWGYDIFTGTRNYEFYYTKLVKDYMDWVWLHEYGNALPALKRMAAKIDAW